MLALAVISARAKAQISPGPLARAHASFDGSLGCASCHGGRTETTAQRCLACHREIGLLREQGRGFHARGAGRGTCSSCHPDHAGRDFQLIQWPNGSPERFDHERGTGYALEQSHATVKCESCHKAELRVSQAATLSKRKTNAGWVGLERDCTSCHTDPHRGRLDGACTRCHDISRWKDAPRFDHAQSRYPLTGKHANVGCAKCHLAPRLRPATDASGRPIAVLRPVPFSDCSSCHSDPHRGQMTVACSRCHESSSFKAVDRKAFDHDRTPYPLRGKHASVACASCHTGPSSSATRPAFSACASCHADPHRTTAALIGKSQDCATCHRVEGFKPATFTVEQHRKGACASCHADAHGGQLAARSDRGACGSCHDVGAWRPSTFGVAAHASLRLALDGAHARVSCGACHAADRRGLRALPAGAASGTTRVALHPPETACAQCHADPHAWRSASASPPTAPCTSCHSTRDFRGTSIDADRHATLGYRLEGAHRAVPCTACHAAIARPRSGSTLVEAASRAARLDLGSAPTTCAGCHADPHGGQFVKLDGGSCDRCHTMNAFKPAGRFDHARDAGFALEGAHARVACVACHRQTIAGRPGAPLEYRKVSPNCESCHSTIRRPGNGL